MEAASGAPGFLSSMMVEGFLSHCSRTFVSAYDAVPAAQPYSCLGAHTLNWCYETDTVLPPSHQLLVVTTLLRCIGQSHNPMPFPLQLCSSSCYPIVTTPGHAECCYCHNRAALLPRPATLLLSMCSFSPYQHGTAYLTLGIVYLNTLPEG